MAQGGGAGIPCRKSSSSSSMTQHIGSASVDVHVGMVMQTLPAVARRGPDGECIVAYLSVHGSIPDAGRFRGPFFLVAAGDWFGSHHMGLHSPREAPHVCTV
jgi:hypothetical protein